MFFAANSRCIDEVLHQSDLIYEYVFTSVFTQNIKILLSRIAAGMQSNLSFFLKTPRTSACKPTPVIKLVYPLPSKRQQRQVPLYRMFQAFDKQYCT